MKTHQSNWVTIPEDTATAKSPAKEKRQSRDIVSHKALWAAGFVVVVIMAVSMIMPGKMTSLLRGSIFEGMEESTINDNYEGLDVVGDPEADAENELVNTQDQGGTTYDNTAVEAETDAVAIQIKPVGTDNDSSDENSSEKTQEEKYEALIKALKDCSLFDEIMQEPIESGEGENPLVKTTITPITDDADHCLLSVDGTELNSDDEKDISKLFKMECKVPKKEYTQESLDKYMNENMEDICSGPLVDMYVAIEEMKSESKKNDGLSNEDDVSNDQNPEDTLNSVSQQLAEFRAKQQAAAAGQTTSNTGINLHGSADNVNNQNTGTGSNTGTGVNSSVSATYGVGGYTNTNAAGNTSDAGYKPNSHRTAVSPYQALEQNKKAGLTVAVDDTNTANDYNSQNYQANLSNANATPESGPKETLMIAFLITFISMLAWKARKLTM